MQFVHFTGPFKVHRPNSRSTDLDAEVLETVAEGVVTDARPGEGEDRNGNGFSVVGVGQLGRRGSFAVPVGGDDGVLAGDVQSRLSDVVCVQCGQRGPQAVAAHRDAQLFALVQVQQPLQLRQHLQQSIGLS